MWKIVECIDLLIIAHLAEIKPGQKVLDIATGIGEPAVTAAEVVGGSSTTTNGGGHVLTIDVSLQRLAIAKKRAMFLGCKGLAFGNGQISRQGVVSTPNYDPHNLIHTYINNNIS
jgi:ubiquinone/menaquinone biosynthesis C-methylase UbiE